MHLLHYFISFVLSTSHFNLQKMKSLCCNAKSYHVEKYLNHTPTYELCIVNNILVIKDYFVKYKIKKNDRLHILFHTTDKTYAIPINTFKPNVYTMIDIYRYFYENNKDKNTFRITDIKNIIDEYFNSKRNTMDKKSFTDQMNLKAFHTVLFDLYDLYASIELIDIQMVKLQEILNIFNHLYVDMNVLADYEDTDECIFTILKNNSTIVPYQYHYNHIIYINEFISNYMSSGKSYDKYLSQVYNKNIFDMSECIYLQEKYFDLTKVSELLNVGIKELVVDQPLFKYRRDSYNIIREWVPGHYVRNNDIYERKEEENKNPTITVTTPEGITQDILETSETTPSLSNN